MFRAQAQPRDAKTLLPAVEAAFFSMPAVLALNSEELELLGARHEMPQPYWDPALRRPAVRKDFLRRFAAVGLLVGCEVVSSQVGCFWHEETGRTAAPHRGCPHGQLLDEVATEYETWFRCGHGRASPLRRCSAVIRSEARR